jgi:predicted ester cyclase
LKQYAAMNLGAFPDVRVSVEDQIAEGDMVVTRWTATGTHTGELMGIPPTGRRIEISGITINRFSGGRIAEDWYQSDDLGMMQQLGVIPWPEEVSSESSEEASPT